MYVGDALILICFTIVLVPIKRCHRVKMLLFVSTRKPPGSLVHGHPNLVEEQLRDDQASIDQAASESQEDPGI
jgi:hypothetical protein